MKTVGILGGMGPLATADLYRKIILHTKAERDQDHIHVIIDGNPIIPDRTDHITGDGDDPLPDMIRSAHTLESAGADFLIMPCNTAHYFFDELSNNVNIPFLNMIELTVKYIEISYGHNTTVGLLATDGTIKSGIYDQYFRKSHINLVKSGDNQKYVMEFIYEGIKKGNYAIGTDGFLKAVNELKEKGAEIFVLGCTELSSASDIYRFQGNFVDPLDILAKKSIEYAGGSVINDQSKKN
jgi:aspartate racemase